MARRFRFAFILLLAGLGTALSAVGGWRYARASAPVNGPIVLISIDTLRADHLPAYGYRKVKTPAIDLLAADGTVFERAYSHAPQTLPAHVSILSGRLPFETGVRDNVGFAVSRSERLLPQMLSERGYTTAAVVSSFVLRKETGIDRGFDFFDARLPVSENEAWIGGLRRDGAESETVAERWLDDQRSPRAFLFLHLYEPHAPYKANPKFSDYSPYDAAIASADDIVGRLIHYLKSHQLYDRSTIVLLSDHGEGLDDHGEQEHGALLYDEAIHVPLIIKQAAGAGAGRRVAEIVQHIDVAPTILDLAKAPIPGNLRGRSLRPALDGNGRPSGGPVYSEALYGRYHFGWHHLTAFTSDRYRYIRGSADEVYDLTRDPHERVNVADDSGHAEAFAALRRAFDRLAPDTVRPAPEDVEAADRERFTALGYVGTYEDRFTTAADSPSGPSDARSILETYRGAVRLAGDRQWAAAIAQLRTLVKRDPEMIDVWDLIASLSVRAGWQEQAVDAYQQIARLRPALPDGYLGASAVLLASGRLDEARRQAQVAADVSAEREGRSRAKAHELLARIALARRDSATARAEAEMAARADATTPLPTFVEARILYDEGEYDKALPLLQQAISETAKSRNPLAELHSYAADCLLHLERPEEAEAEYANELLEFPQNTRARAGLATLYHASERHDEADRLLDDMVRIAPTRESFATAARLWTAFGRPREAAAVRAQAQQILKAAPKRLILR